MSDVVIGGEGMVWTFSSVMSPPRLVTSYHLLSLLIFSPNPHHILSSPSSYSLLSLIISSPLPPHILSSPSSYPLLSLLISSPLPPHILSSPSSSPSSYLLPLPNTILSIKKCFCSLASNKIMVVTIMLCCKPLHCMLSVVTARG